MSEKAPMPPWWVEEQAGSSGGIDYVIYGGRPDAPVPLCSFYNKDFSNAKELADLIVQRTKQ